MDSVNEAQRAAICHIDGPMMVLAGPGSGKTFVITRRLKYLIEEGRVEPSSILVITFTKASAIEMQERFEKLMEDKYYPVVFGTFHAVYFNILREEQLYDAGSIITEKEKREFLKSIIQGSDIEISDDNTMELILSDISKIKNDGSSPHLADIRYMSSEDFEKIYYEYDQMLKDAGKLDFDDMVLECRKLLTTSSNVLRRLRERIHYILIDEFQDINPMQYEVIKMIAMPENNLFIVGDDDQSIYGFRGSKPEIMLGFENEYPMCKKVILSTNYRSTSDIVDGAQVFIKNNKERFEKQLISNHGKGQEITVAGFGSSENQMEYIKKVIKTLQKCGRMSDVAVIFRTNKGARNMTRMLTENHIPYIFKEKPVSFFSHPVSKDILAILDFAHGKNTRDVFVRFMNKPSRYIPRLLITSNVVDINELSKRPNIKAYLRNNLRKLAYDIEQIKNLEPFAAINYIRKAFGYEKYIIGMARDKKQDAGEVLEIMDLVIESAKNMETYEQFKEFIEEYERNLNESAMSTDEDTDKITLITMHGSKGLEYNTVILPDVNEGNVPQAKAKTNEALEEERRVFYVAMTRAKEKLIMTYVEKNKNNRMKPSRFLNEMS